MGYRSDVALAFTKKGMEKFKAALESEEINATAKKQVPELLDCANKHFVEDDGSESWFWEQIKWYQNWHDDFADVEFLENLMTDMDEEDYYFVRIGEDYEDSEIRGDWYDNPFGITFCRQIVFDCR